MVNSQQVKINEVMTANASTIMDPENYNFSEWVELYNSGNTSIVISGYFFSNDKSNLKKWRIPDSYIIPASGFLIIWMDKLNTGLHANFRARTNRELLILSGSDGKFIDSISVNYPVSNFSFGRNPDDSNVWCTFETPTPGKSNMGNILSEQCSQPIFNLPAGRYSSPVTIILQNPTNSGTMYYSLDGSDPTENSNEYTSPITITNTQTIKARIFEQGKIPGPMVVNTYFISEHEFTLPLIVSISTKPVYLWDSEIGIYTEGNNGIAGNCYGEANWNQNWERPAHFELFTADGKKVIDSDAGIKISGGCSRRFNQKSLSVNFRDKYGNDEIRYTLFNSKPTDRFKSLRLRNSGDDNLHSQFHDGMIQTCIMGQMDLDYVGFTPSVTYINGEYWGILNIREKTTEDYLYSNYNLDDDSFDLLERDSVVIAGSNDDYLEMLDYMNNHSLSTSENYYYIKDKIDIESYIDYQIAEIYVANHDWPENNIKFWKSKRPGSKWRWIYFDTDFGFGLDYGPEDNTLTYATDPDEPEDSRNPPWSTFVFRMLLNNEEFKNRFIDKFLVYIGTTYRSSRTLAIIDSISNLMYTEITYTFDRWDQSMSVFNYWVSEKRNFAVERPEYMVNFIRDYFEMQTPLSLKVRSNVKENKTFSMNNVIVNDTVFDGKYFENREVRIKALNSSGYKFKYWEITRLSSSFNTQYVEKDQRVDISEQKELILPVTSDMVITAFFDTVEIVNNLSINEICASNSTFSDVFSEYDDWIELYNAGMDTVDLAGFFMTDNYSSPEKHLLSFTDSDETLIYPRSFRLLWADGQPEQGFSHLNFKLNKESGEVALVQNDHGKIIFLDSISYHDQQKDYSYGRYPDGANNWLLFDEGGTPGISNMSSDISISEEENNIYIYPNPVRNNAKIVLAGEPTSPIQVTIINSFGHIKRLIELNWRPEGYLIDFSEFENGLYYIRIQSGKAIVNQKIVVLR